MLDIGLHLYYVIGLSSEILFFLKVRIICYANFGADFLSIRAPINGLCLQFSQIFGSTVLAAVTCRILISRW